MRKFAVALTLGFLGVSSSVLMAAKTDSMVIKFISSGEALRITGEVARANQTRFDAFTDVSFGIPAAADYLERCFGKAFEHLPAEADNLDFVEARFFSFKGGKKVEVDHIYFTTDGGSSFSRCTHPRLSLQD